jgi:Ca-activated chloride channel family protein
MMVDLHTATWIAGAVALLAAGAEWLHARRVKRLRHLAFGPGGAPRMWTKVAAPLRVLALAAVAWGLLVLLVVPPRAFDAQGELKKDDVDPQHILLVLDVSPSMKLKDAGPNRDRSRMARAREVMESFFDRVPLKEWRVSVVAFYTGAIPVVEDTMDFEVVRNILGDLPMDYAFQPGKTELFAGLKGAAQMADKWKRDSTTVVVISDGDTVPASGMPRMPAAVRSVLVVGVGDSKQGSFIDGRNSRQDVGTLRQVATRLGGTFFDGNEKHLPTALVAESAWREGDDDLIQWTLREFALFAVTAGAAILALLPLLLALFGSGWRAGVRSTVRSGAYANSGTKS